MEDKLVLCLLLSICVISEARENAYGDKGIVLTSIPHVNTGIDDFKTIKSRPGGPLANFSGTFPGFNFDNLNDIFIACAVDYDMNYLYIYDYNNRDITLLENYNSSAIKEAMTISRVHSSVSQESAKLAVDWLAHNLYWTDPVMGRICMRKGGPTNSSQNFKTIVTKLNIPRGIAVDPIARKIFWTAWVPYNDRSAIIESASLTGENRMVIHTTNLNRASSIVAHPATQRIYYIDGYDIKSSTYDGTDTTSIRRFSKGTFFDIAIFENIILATDTETNTLHFLDKTSGADRGTRIGSSTKKAYGVCVYAEQNTNNVEDGCSSIKCDHICVNEPSGATCHCYDGYTLVEDTNGQNTACQEITGAYHRALIMSTKKDLCKVPLSFLISDEEYTPFYFYNGDDGETIDFIDLNMERRLVYFVVNTTIYSVPIDGGPNQRTTISNQIRTITGMTYDWVNDHIYYALSGNNTIYILEPGSGRTLAKQLKADINPRNLVVSPHQGNIYYLSGLDKLEKGPLNLEQNETTEVTLEYPFTNPVHMHHDVKYEMLFVLDLNVAFNTVNIIGITYNGTEEIYDETGQFLIDFGVYQEFIIMVERHTQSETTKIISADFAQAYPFTPMGSATLNGTVHVTNIMVLDKEELQPDYPSPCGNIKQYGGCEQVCVPAGEMSTCECQFGSTIAEDGKTCQTSPVSDNFLLLSDITYNEVLQISLDDYANINQIKGVYALGRPNGVMYNYMTDRVIWASLSNSQVWSVNLNGTNSSLISNTDDVLSYPDRFALDPSTGLVYYTGIYYYPELYFSFIGVLNTETGLDTILTTGQFQIPRAIRLHPQRGIMFVSDHGDNPFIARLNMDGSDKTDIVTEDITLPNGIAIDYEADRLFWTEGFTNKIYSCDFDGKSRVMVLEDEGVHLQDLVLMDNYLYYTAWDRNFITKVHKTDITDKTHIGPVHGLGRIHALDIYNSALSVNVPVNSACKTNNGGCSHFCFPTSTGSQCGCDRFNVLLSDDRNCENADRCPAYIGAALLDDNDACLRLLGNNCAYTCDVNYIKKSTAPPQVTCIADSSSSSGLSWDASDLCDEVLCPVMDNVDFPDSCRRSVGDDCSEFICASGYERNEAVTSLTCVTNGIWSETEPLCLEKCPAFTDTTEHGSLASSCDRLPGMSCQFTCMSGYQYASTTQTSVDCVAGSGWSATTTSLCKEIRCKDFVGNGIVNDTCSLAVGAVCRYHCTERFEPDSTVTTITCNVNGVWDIGPDPDILLCNENPNAQAQTQSNKETAIGVGVGVAVLVLIIIAVIVLFFLYRRGKLPIVKSVTPPNATKSFENPRYANNNVAIQQSSGTEANRDFGYATLEEDSVDQAAKSANPVYDNSASVL